MRKILFPLIVLIFILIPKISFSATVTLAWDPVDPTPDGYRLFMREESASYDYETPEWEGDETTYIVPSVPDDTDVYFVVRAYVGEDESVDSNEVVFNSSSTGTGDPDPLEKVLHMYFEDSDNWEKKQITEYYGTTANTLTCNWTAVTDAEGYEVRLYHMERDVENVLASGKTTNTTLTFQLPRTGHYIVKIRPCRDDYTDCAEWSESIDPTTSDVDGESAGWAVYGYVESPGGIVIE